MGFRWMVLFVAGAACAARGAHAEDIGHEPLLPERLSAPAPGGSREPAAGPSDGADADLSPADKKAMHDYTLSMDKVKGMGAALDDFFGISVATSGSTAVVGATGAVG